MKAVSITEANTDLHRLTVRGGRCAIAEAIGGSEDGFPVVPLTNDLVHG